MQNNLSNQGNHGNPLNFLNNIKGLRVASLNVNSMVKHIDQLRILRILHIDQLRYCPR